MLSDKLFQCDRLLRDALADLTAADEDLLARANAMRGQLIALRLELDLHPSDPIEWLQMTRFTKLRLLGILRQQTGLWVGDDSVLSKWRQDVNALAKRSP